MKLYGKVAIVTGGGGGIGAALAVALVEAGAKVLADDVDGQRARSAIEGLPASRARSMVADVVDSAALGRLIDTAERALGPVDLFFANAGVATAVELGSSDEDGMPPSTST